MCQHPDDISLPVTIGQIYMGNITNLLIPRNNPRYE